MSITRTLPCPLVNQLSEPTMDGAPDENRDDNCLFASCASALMGAHPGSAFDGDEIKDAVMGQGYQGFGYFSVALTTYLAAHGLTISAQGGASLSSLAHTSIDRGVPCLAVIPSMWDDTAGAVSPSFSTHVVLLCGDGPGELRAMNPWGGFWHDNSDAWWQSRFCYGALWPLTPKAGVGSMAGVPAGWHDDGVTLMAPNSVPVVRGFRDHILTAPGIWPAALVPVEAEHGAANSSVEQGFALLLHWDAATNVGERDGRAVDVQIPTPAPAPTPTPAPDPKAAAALAVVQQLKSVLAEV